MVESTLVIAFFVGLLILCVFTKIFSMPLKILWNCIYNSIIGAIVLYIINFLGFVYIPINFITALIAGIFGVPGVLVLAIYSMYKSYSFGCSFFCRQVYK